MDECDERAQGGRKTGGEQRRHDDLVGLEQRSVALCDRSVMDLRLIEEERRR